MPIGNGNIGLLLYSAVNSTHSLESGKEPAITQDARDSSICYQELSQGTINLLMLLSYNIKDLIFSIYPVSNIHLGGK